MRFILDQLICTLIDVIWKYYSM